MLVQLHEISSDLPSAERGPVFAKSGGTVEAEVPFEFKDVFFSRTNEKGHIQFGNELFQKTCLYSWPELCGKPHNIVRHPDMPRAIFRILWDTIQKGEPACAYVKNRAKDGRYYWVLAIITPIPGGYLSVRIKPSSTLFELAKREYAPLAANEKKLCLKPVESASRFLAKLEELGFQDHGAFMATALTEEITARDQILGRASSSAALNFLALSRAAALLLKEANAVYANYALHRNVPLNLRIQAARLGSAGASIAVISMSYNSISKAINTLMARFIVAAQEVFSAINKGLFLCGTAQIQREMCAIFRSECSLKDEQALSNEIELLDQQLLSYEKSATGSLRAIAVEAERFNRLCAEIKRTAEGLETIRIMGKVEYARMETVDAGLIDLLGNLERYQEAITDGLQKMLTISQAIQRNSEIQWDRARPEIR